MADLTPSQRTALEKIATAEPVGGLLVPFVSRNHAALEDAGLVTVSPGARRVRCTAAGLEEANRPENTDGQ